MTASDPLLSRQLAILDLEHDMTVRYPAIQPVFGASFALMAGSPSS